MKLISCYIDNFGGLSKFSLDFQAGITVVYQPNGFGKTTLAEFIRAMFYGFPRKPPKGMGRREKYRPWNGGKCRGNLTFEYEGVRYRIERSFGATPKADTCKIYDLSTGRETSRFTSDIGVELFGLDADSFERSTYLPQSRETGPLTTDSIRAKLGNLVEDTADVGSFEKAMETLRAKRSGYVPYRGRGGAVAEATERITRTQQDIDDAGEAARDQEKTAAELAALEAEQIRVAAEIDICRREISAAGEAALRQARRQQYEQMTDALNDAGGCLEELEQRYPKGFPDAGGLNALTDAVERLAGLEAGSVITEEDRRAARFVEEHRARFADGIPESEEFDRIYRIRDQRREAQIRLEAAAMPAGEAAELAALDAFFAPGLPDEGMLAQQEEALEEAARLRRENLELASKTVEMPRYKVPNPLTVPLLLGGGIIAILAGIWKLAGGDAVPGWLAIILGAAALAGALWLRLRSSATRTVTALSPQIQTQVRENEEKAAALEAQATAFTAEYGGEAPARIRRRMNRLAELARRDGELAGVRRELNDWLAEYDREMRAFFEKYHCPADADGYDALNRFQRQCDAWQRANHRIAERDQRIARREREMAGAEKILADFQAEFSVSPRSRAEVLAIREDARQYAALTAAVRELEGRIAAFRRTHGVMPEPAPEIPADPGLLRRREAELLKCQNQNAEKLTLLRQRERRLREHADRLPQLRDELAYWQEKRREDERNAALLDSTMDFLTQARSDLAKAYMGGIGESFRTLLGRMTGEAPEGIMLTSELDVRLQRDGVSRELTYFSAGQADTVMLCMRVALADALFGAAKPALILDDPFVNLDDERMKEALALLHDLSRDRQIIYLVCNAGRVSESFVSGAESGN